MPRFTAVLGKDKVDRIVSVEARNEDRARHLIYRRLRADPQCQELCDQWVVDGEHLVEKVEEPEDLGEGSLIGMTDPIREDYPGQHVPEEEEFDIEF